MHIADNVSDIFPFLISCTKCFTKSFHEKQNHLVGMDGEEILKEDDANVTVRIFVVLFK